MSSEIEKTDFINKYYHRDKSWKPLTKPKVESKDFFSIIIDKVKHKNEAVDILCVGLKGTSKSSSMLGAASLLDPNFSIKNVAFTMEELINLTRVLERGSVIIFDDAGTMDGASSRRTQTKENQIMSDVAQMCRTDGFIIIYTTTEDSRLEKRIRTQFTYILSPIQKITYNHGLASVIELFENKQFMNKEKDTDSLVETKRSRVSYGSGNLTHIIIPHSPKSLMIEYNKRRSERLESVRKKAINTIRYESENAEK